MKLPPDQVLPFEVKTESVTPSGERSPMVYRFLTEDQANRFKSGCWPLQPTEWANGYFSRTFLGRS